MRRAALLYAVTAVAWTAAVWAAPATRVIGRAEGELRDHVWVAWLVQTRLWDDHALPLHFPQARFPLGLDLYPLDPVNHAFLAVVAPLVGLLPALALLSTALLALAGFAGARLAAAVGASPPSALLAGLLTQAGPPLLGAWADTQTEGMGIAWAIFTVAELVRAGPWSTGRALRLGAFAALAVGSTPYQVHALTLVGLPLAGALLVRRHLPVRAALLAGCLALPAAGLAGAGMIAGEAHPGGQLDSRSGGDADWPPGTSARDAVLPPTLRQASALSPLPAVAWPREARFLPPSTGPRRWSGLVLPALALLAAARSARARWLLAAAGLYAALAAGTARDYAFTELSGARIPLPFDLWYRYYPLGHLAWKPAQYAVPAWAFACAAASLLPPRALGLGALFAAVELQLRGPTPAPLPAMSLAPLPAYSWLDARDSLPVRERPGVVEFPARGRSRGGVDALPYDALLGQMVHRHPIGETFGRGENRPHQALLDALAVTVGWSIDVAPPLDAGWRSAGKAGFGWLLVHPSLLTPGELDRLDAALATRTGPPEVFADGVRLYAIPPVAAEAP